MVATAKSPKAYICNFRYGLSKTVDVERLRSAWECVKRAEPVLRSRIVWNEQNHNFLQATIAHEYVGESRSGFEGSMTFGQDLAKIRISRVDRNDRRAFHIRLHHSIIDGRSLALVLRKVQEAYESHHSLSPGPSFKSFISHIYHDIQHHRPRSQAFWANYLDGSAVLDFPRLPSVSDHTATTDGSQSTQIPFDLDLQVKRWGVSPATILYAATALVLGAHAGVADVVSGLTLSGRNVPIDDIDNMIGPTIATVPLRTRLDPHMSIEQYFKNVRRQVLDLIPHQHYGLQEIKQIGPGARAACQFRTHVIVQPSDQTASHHQLLEKLDNGTSGVLDDIPLSIEFVLGSGQISVKCCFDSFYISHMDVEVVISHLSCVLQDFSILPLSSELFQVRLADDAELFRIHSWARDRRLDPLPSAIEQPHATNGDGALLKIEEDIEHQWIVVRDDSRGGIWPAPILCPGKLAFSTFGSLDNDQQDTGLGQSDSVYAPRLWNGSRSSHIYTTEFLSYCGADGHLHIWGKSDRILTIKGRSVKPWDSEYLLRSVGGRFTDCVVDGIFDETGCPKLAAFIHVQSDGGQCQVDSPIAERAFDSSFREMCSQARQKILNVLPEPCVPTHFVPMSYIPMEKSSNIDRAALAYVFHNAMIAKHVLVTEDERDGFVGRLPETSWELDIEAIFQEVFEIEARLTTMDHFFHLGGDSFTAISLIAAAKRRNYVLSVSQVYRNPRLGDLANVAMLSPKAISGHEAHDQSPASDPFDFLRAEAAQLCKVFENQIEDLYPASAFQASLATTSSSTTPNHDPSSYFAEITFEMPQSADLSRLSHALEQQASDPGTISPLEQVNSLSCGEGKSLFHYQLLQGDAHEKPRLVLFIHHLLYDGWTLDMFLNDITYNYFHPQAERNGRRPYSYFIQHLKTVDKKEAADYWIKQLANMAVAQYPQVPTSFVYKPHAEDHIVLTRYLDTSNIRRNGISTATVVMASWALLLSSYCDTNDVCYATVLSGRDDGFLEDIMGPTIATVPMRVIIKTSDDVSDFLAAIQLNLLDMREHQHYGLDNMSRLPAEGSRNVTKLASILVMQQDLTWATKEDEHEEFLSMVDGSTHMLTDFPLVVQSSFNAKTSQLQFDLAFDNICLSTQEAQRMLRQLLHVVDQLSALAGPISQVDIATAEDKADICAWNLCPLPTSSSLLHQVFEEMVLEAPQSPAIDSIYGASNLFRKLSYHQLDLYAADLAYHIAENCSSQNPFVAICFSKSPLMVISMLAVLKCGRAFVPMDSSSATARIQTILDSLGGDVPMITDISHVDRFQNIDLIALDEKSPNIVYKSRNGVSRPLTFQASERRKQPLFGSRALPEGTAYLLHTSGSTGKPKGIVVSHSTSTTALTSLRKRMKINKATRTLQLASLAFDASILEIFITLVSGGCLCMLPNESRLAGEIASAANALGVNLIMITPTLASFLNPKDFSDLRTLVLIGEPSPKQLVEGWLSSETSPWIINGYGPAEAGFIACVNTSLSAEDTGNVGYPVGCHAFITDPADPNRLAAIGAIGELIICGHNVSDGYFSNSNSKAFGRDWRGLLDLGIRGGMGLRYYSTGDLAKYCSNGSIQILGRKDTQRKIHGQRIELGGIETSILCRTQFHGVVVDLLGSSTLVAFLELNASAGPFNGLLPLDAIRREFLDTLMVSLKDVLPAYMIPTIYVPLENFPTNSSGKTDRSLLRAAIEPVIANYRMDQGAVKRQPMTEKESILRQLWADAIAIKPETIGIDDGFSALGGSSVGVIRLLQLVRKRQMKLDVSAVYKVDTLSEMAVMLETTDNITCSESAPPPFSLMKELDQEQCIALASRKCHVPDSAVLDVYPCSYMQEAMMVSSAKVPGSYFVQSVFRLPQSINLVEFQRSLQSVWEKHDILRTRICLDDNFSSVQAVLDEPLRISIFKEPLDVCLKQDKPPGYGDSLSRCAIVVSEEATYLLLSQHHAVFDAWSLGILMQEIKRSYSACPSESIRVHHQYSSYIRATLQLQISSDAAKFWRELLDQSNIARLPGVKKGIFTANQEEKTAIDLPLKQTHSLATLVEAAWSILLSRYVDSEDVCFGVVQSGRAALINDLDAIVGPTLVSIPRRLRPTGRALVTNFLADVQKSRSEAQPWEQYSLGQIRRLSDSAYQACNFQSMVVVQHPPDLSVDLSKENVELELLEQSGAWSDNCLALECQPLPQGKLSVSLSFDDRLFPEEDARWMSHHFCRLLLEIITKPNHQIHDLDMAGPEGIQQAHQWNDYSIPTSEQRIEKLFHDRLESWSAATAIDAVDARLTYQSLDELSSRLALEFKESGLSRGDLVPLCVEKSAVMIIIILAVLKAGGAYVPLEIDLPFGRMQLIIRDLNARLIVCTPSQEDICKRLGCSVITLDMKRLQKLTPLDDIRAGELNSPLWSDANASSDLAYIIYTSGSTGVPKGVMMEHSALSTTILERALRIGYKSGLRCVLYSSYAFDSSIWEIFASLLHGACLFIPSAEQRLATLPEYLNEKKIEVFASTPTIVQNILQSPSRVPHLTIVDLGGEAMTKSVIQEWSSSVRLINDYGPTEACIDACMNDHITPDTDPNNIGYSNGDATHLWIVEPADHSRLAPVGCAGELLISGPTLARGYLNDEDKTAKAFINCGTFTWVKKGDERCYATGDIVRRNGDGSLTYCGRKDMQIQLHGNRIEVGEIEHILARCDGIRLAAVESVPRQNNDVEMLVAFLTLYDESFSHSPEAFIRADETTRAIINGAVAKASGALPRYMIPKFYLPLHAMPLSVGGKIDRKSLRKMYSSVPREMVVAYRGDSASKRSPRTEIQRTLQCLWSEVLAIEKSEIGLDDDFAILGGDSLAAIKLASKATEAGLELGVATLLQASKLEDMAAAARLSSNVETDAAIKDPAPFSLLGETDVVTTLDEQENIEDVLPATSMQTVFVIRAQRWYQPYYFWFFVDVDQRLSPQGIHDACNILVQKHQILRTTFRVIGKHCYQVVEKSSKADFRVLKSRGPMDNGCCEAIDEDVVVPVEFGRSLTRFRLVVNQDTGDQRLSIGLSHAQYDGFCTDHILTGLYHLCLGEADQAKSPSYSRYIQHTQQVVRSPATPAFWTQLLKGSKMTTIGQPSSIHDSPPDRSIQRLRFSIDKRPHGMSFAIVMKTAWSLVLARISNSNDVIFGTIVSGRNAPFKGAEDVVGPCLNLLPVRVVINNDTDCKLTFADLMQQVHEQQIATIPYEATPTEQIIEQSPWPQSTRFGSVLLHQNLPPTSISQDGGGADDTRMKWKYAGAAGYGNVMFDFTDCWITTLPTAGNDCMKCWLTYHETQLPTAAAEGILDFFLEIVETIANYPERSLRSLVEMVHFDTGLLPNEVAAPNGGCSNAALAPASEQQPDEEEEPLTNGSSPSSSDISNIRTRLQHLWDTVLSPCTTTAPHQTSSNGIDPQTSFFTLGGTSLSAAHLSVLCSQQEGLHLSLQDIYDYPTLELQCEVLTGKRKRVERERVRLVFYDDGERDVGT
ncbi:MAG: hypothetical protein Q9220_003593 [cf. Caloplaca sp. 1 TL-2023]